MRQRRHERKRQEGTRRGHGEQRRRGNISRKLIPGAAGRSGLPVPADDIIGFIYSRDGEASFKDIMAFFDLARGRRKEMEALLASLCHQNILDLDKEDGLYTIKPTMELLEGVISANPRGFAFAFITGPDPKAVGGRDVFIPGRELGTATHGDKVLLAIVGRQKDRLEGRVLRVLERTATRLVGIFMAGRTTGLVAPEDERFAFQVVVRREDFRGAKNGEAVLAEIIEYRAEQRNPLGRIIEVLGDPDDLAVQTEMVIRKFSLPHVFSDKALTETEQLDSTIRLDKGREDFREIQYVTIDGETARDFDDAVAVEKTKKGFRLHVSIADVSHYVKTDTTLDLEAYERGTSVYFPTRVIPMLPERLSNNLCSLVPNEERFVFTAILDFDRTGQRVAKRFAKGLIKSRHRLTYTLVRKILVDNDQAAQQQYQDMLVPLENMAELAAQMEKRRMARGSIGFELPEAEIQVDPDGRKVTAITRSERNLAHKLIEEFMLAANEAVAETISNAVNIDHQHQAIYRIHEVPDPLKVAEFAEFAGSLGLHLPPGSGTPTWFGKVLALVAGTPQEYIVNNLLLRTMKQACYSAENVGHFGLAAEYYTHFTSPIRRYPDLMVHRLLERIIHPPGPKQPAGKELRDSAEAGPFLSKRERTAVDADREMINRLQVRFMVDKVGNEYDGIVAGVASFGLFVDLLETFVSGMIEITALKDDTYHHDEPSHTLVGKRTGKRYQLGNLIRVQVSDVDVNRRRVYFTVVDVAEQKGSGPATATGDELPGDRDKRQKGRRRGQGR